LAAASEGLDKGATFTARFKIDDSLSDLTALDPPQLESSRPCSAKIAVTASTNSANRRKLS
jgi:hypothetical protein